MSSLDVVFVYAFDITQSIYYARVDQVQGMVVKKLAQFPGSCWSYVRPELANNRYTSGKRELTYFIEDFTTKYFYDNMASGLREAERLLNLSNNRISNDRRRIILFFSDGSTNKKGRFFDTAEDFVSKNYPVHTFTAGSDAYNPVLCNIAANSLRGTFTSTPIPDKPDESLPLSLLLDRILSGTMNDDDMPPALNSGTTGSNQGLVSIKEVKYMKDDAALTAELVTAEVEIRATASAVVREGLDLVAVLDVSCRKDTPKIDSIKKAMKFTINKLTPVDRLSIVTFCDGAARLTPLRCMTPAAKEELIAIVEGLSVSARGTRDGVNIKAGLETGLAVMADRVHKTARTANIFLVSDSKQTVGDASVVDPGQVAVYTFCLGSGGDLDEHHQLLSDLATKSPGAGGMFSVVAEGAGASLGVPMSQVLGGLLTVVAQDVKLTLAPKSAECARIDVSTVARGKNKDHYTPVDDSNGVKTIKFGSLFAGEARKVLITLRVKDSPEDDQEGDYDAVLAQAHHTFTAQGKPQWQARPHDTTQIKIRRTANPSEGPGDSRRARQVQAERVRLDQAKAISEATVMADAQDLKGARNRLEKAQKKLEKMVKLDDGDKLVTWLSAELQQLSRFMDNKEIYKAKGRAYALASEASHGRQRYCARGADGDDADDAFTTPRMDAYREQAKDFDKYPTSSPVPSADEDLKKELATISLAAVSGDLASNLSVAIEALKAIQRIITATDD